VARFSMSSDVFKETPVAVMQRDPIRHAHNEEPGDDT
jgi:hypothetical protein